MSALICQRPSSIDRRDKRLGNGQARSRRHRIKRAVGPIRPRSFRVYANYLDALYASRVRIHRQKPKALGLKFGCGFTRHLFHQGSPASGVLRGAVARLLLCSGLLRACPDRNRTNLIGIALYGVAAMAGPKTPRELADRMRDHRAQHRARDGFVRETFTQPRDDARQTVREFLDRYPKPAQYNFLMPSCTGS